ncbi:unnamed protein product [Rotaria magnacalcarata]|uniref:HAT C-terminal dimerisation domain-containing protein n=2 Tax=Rotaria magnacalcarata TaxID=392030 RepID=A0A820FXR4_9BILA|nr:unnamed protein product [Rotaria magnacalcarata]
MVNFLKKQLLQKYEQHCVQTISYEAEEAITIASFLNPTTYFYLREDENFIETAKKLIVIKHKDQIMTSSHVTNSCSTRLLSKNDNNKPLRAIESFLVNCEASFSSNSSSTSENNTFTIQQEIGYYTSSIDRETDFESFWKINQQNLPGLTNLARYYCMMPATSVASESAFSVAGYIQRKTRSSLSPTTLRYLMLLRNYEISDFTSS